MVSLQSPLACVKWTKIFVALTFYSKKLRSLPLEALHEKERNISKLSIAEPKNQVEFVIYS